MKIIELKMPPAFLFIIIGGLMYWVHVNGFGIHIPLPMKFEFFAVCFVASGIFGLGGIYEFKKHKTSVHPVELHKAVKVVDSGIFRLSRNPMYVGLLLLLLGYAYYLQDIISLLLCLIFVLYMNQFQIKPEERHLEQKFGKDYLEYKQKVRRWL
ncbi:hypothetical protein DI392_07475 [Vibrio albus]|jgi:protein-S-isoprenylcysteine O-methyltransferase Ste14|uniref:Isoprenylcysteine carboxylmethyltransferase family protein n=1 Tax=Vibrio albus TaxID=2200953 RepID=A0A2U3BB59_9VIBR|nr:isoprenylcysteine carboxylmethyltransferase family protein [Vibrio albus]PWI34032.1 hypothetical protein DI392_07475 [Vibrio albus]